LPDIDAGAQEYEISQSKQILIDHGFNPRNFAYPHGDYDESTDQFVTPYYASSRITDDSLNPMPDTVDHYHITSKGTNATKTIGEYQDYINTAIANRQWLVLNSHIVAPTCGAWCVRIDMMENIIDYALQNRVYFDTIDRAVSGQWQQ